MAKQKGIKSLLVKVQSQGAKETNKELSKIEETAKELRSEFYHLDKKLKKLSHKKN